MVFIGIMSPVKLYHFPPSAPSRGALLAARAIGVPVEIETIDLFKKEQLKESFLKINPQHCVPTLDDDGFVVWESRAIASYLADKYGKDDQLYPKDLKRRAIVDQRLYFDASNLYVKVRNICVSTYLPRQFFYLLNKIVYHSCLKMCISEICYVGS